MQDAVTTRIAVSLPVTIDFRGVLSRGVTCDLEVDRITLVAGQAPNIGTRVHLHLCFNRQVATMPLMGHVTAIVQEETESKSKYRLTVQLHDMTDIERAVLESCYQELQNYLTNLETPKGQRPEAIWPGNGSNPRALLSIFLTDNPYVLPYRLPRPGIDVPTFPPSFAAMHQLADFANGQTLPEPSPTPTLTKQSGWSLTLVSEVIRSGGQLLRDLAIRILPGPLARMIAPKIEFAFIAHPRDLSDVPRKFPFARLLSPRIIERWFRYQWPFVASYITGLKTVHGRPVIGAMLISPLTTEQMVRNPRVGRRRVYETIRLAQRMGARIAGLGAFTSIVTKDGLDLPGTVTLGLTTGNPHSAAIAVQNVIQGAALTNLSLPHATAAIIGGGGSVGSACAKLLAPLVARVIIVDIKKESLRNVVTQIEGQGATIEGTADLNRVLEADIVIAVTNNPHTLVGPQHLKAGAIVVDAAQPKNVSELIPTERPDVLVIESAIVETPDINCHFDLGLSTGEALGCLSETMILAAIGWEGHYSLGKADPKHGAQVLSAGRDLGFRLAFFRNSTGYATEADLVRVAQARVSAGHGV